MCENIYDDNTNLFDVDPFDTPKDEKKCNGCGQAICNMVKSSNGERFNWYCEMGNEWRSLEIAAPKGFQVPRPHWCPKYNKNGESTTRTTTSTVSTMETTKSVYESMTQVKPMTPWDDIKENTIYHVPPMMGQNRRDILVTKKTDYIINYKVLQKNMSVNNATYTLYPSMQLAKFLVPHKNLKVELIRR